MLAALVEFPSGDEADGRADSALTGKSDCQHGVRSAKGVGVSKRNERAEAIGFQQGNSRANVAGYHFCRERATSDMDGYILGLENDSGVGVNSSSGIDKKPTTKSDTHGVAGTDTDDGLAVMLKEALDLGIDLIAQRGGFGGLETHEKSHRNQGDGDHSRGGDLRNSGGRHR